MAAIKKDPTEPIRVKAGQYSGVDKGTACTQSSFKTGGKAFLYVGPQGARFKAMFKLGDSVPIATRLAEEEPDRFEIGSNSWVTARFTAEQPMPKKLWEKWLEESYQLTSGGGSGKKSVVKKKARGKTTKKG